MDKSLHVPNNRSKEPVLLMAEVDWEHSCISTKPSPKTGHHSVPSEQNSGLVPMPIPNNQNSPNRKKRNNAVRCPSNKKKAFDGLKVFAKRNNLQNNVPTRFASV